MYLLHVKEYKKAIDSLKTVKINSLFAKSVVEQHVKGRVYTDDTTCPKSFYIVHPYGMSLLYGDPENKTFNERFVDYMLNQKHKRDRSEWMQAYPGRWNRVLVDLLADRLVKSNGENSTQNNRCIGEHVRVNFRFNPDRYQKFKADIRYNGYKIIPADAQVYDNMTGTVIPKYFWRNAHHFLEDGIGFSLIIKGCLAATAYSSFLHGDKLEIGIETLPNFRNQGLASVVCSALIDYCIANQFEPIWSCRLTNGGSYHLAIKLGFDPVASFPYYELV